MEADLIATLIDIAIGIGVFVGMVAVPLGVFHKRIASWWRLFSQAGPAIQRIEQRQDSMDKAMNLRLSLIEASQRLTLDANDQVATFETDALGRNVLVNATYARWLGCDKTDLLGWKFLNFVVPEDQDKVREELALAHKEARPFRIEHGMRTRDGKVFRVEKVGSPLPDPGVPVKWIGTIRRIGADG